MPALSDIGWPDLAAPVWYVLLWAGYACIADHPRLGRSTLMSRMHQYRLAWMRQMMTRDVRMVDTQVTSLLSQNVSFITSNTILLIGGLVAILGARDQVLGVLNDIPLVAESSGPLWEAKILLLILTFVYAFFKFTWALRQFNYVAIMIGAAPPPAAAASPLAERFAVRTAQVASRAADHFNKALRAYYFGLAALSWLVNAWLFMALTAWVIVVIWRREFRSATLSLLGPVDEPLEEPS
jgi:uncharacterized membrane protein